MTEIDTPQVYKQLKKQNGEAFARIIRDAVLLDVPNIVHILEFAGNDPQEAKQIIHIIRDIYKTPKTSNFHSNKNPLELLDEAGYDAFVVKTRQQKDSIKKYFRPKEELCTFKDPNRHKDYYIIHAIKRGADKIKPSIIPCREDEYGRSVISIQIAKTGGFISIKNRYNHTVENPDATFNNNPDNIIPGLTESLKKYFRVSFNTSNHPLLENFVMVKDQILKFNSEYMNYYVGPSYVSHGSDIILLNPDYQIPLWVFVLNTQTNEVNLISHLDGLSRSYDVGSADLQAFFQDKKIKIEKNPNNKNEKIILADGIKVAHIVNGDLVDLYLPGVTSVGDYFLATIKTLRSLNMPDLERCGYDFLDGADNLKILNVPKLKYVSGPLFLNALDKLKRQFIIITPENQQSTSIKIRIAINDLRKKLFNKSKAVLEQTNIY